jgi:hypothetical protein
MRRRDSLFYSLLLLICLAIFAPGKSFAVVVTNNWKGTTADWNTATNWSSGSIPGSTDIVQIGVAYGFGYSPNISALASNSCGSIVFGTLGNITLTVNGTLLVNGNILQEHPALPDNITTTITGTGTLTCVNLQVGDNTTPLSLANLTTVTTNIAALNITGNLISNSATLLTLLGGAIIGILNNDASFIITNDNTVNNTVTVTGQVETTNVNPGSLLGLISASATIKINVTGSHAATLVLLNAAAVSISSSTYGSIDFYNPSGGTGTSTVDYAGTTAQTVYTNGVAGLDNTPSTYQNITFAAAGTKKSQSGSLLIAGNWNSASGKVDVVTNNPSVYFQGTTQSLIDGGSNGGSGVYFQNVFFQGGGTKTISSGNFSVDSAGVLTMAASSTLAAGGLLTLVSDSISSASVAPVPTSCYITGNVNVQRFVKGSLTSLNKRGYRLFSSAVYTGSVTTPLTNNVFDMSYILNSAYISGCSGTTNGFNSPNGVNPTLYIYREDINPSNSSFTSGNWKGIGKINNTPIYNIGTQSVFNANNTVDTTTVLPVGNGVLYYFIGNQNNNSTQTGSKTSYPFDYPESVVFTQVGQVNTGTVNVRLWYKSTNKLSYTTLSNNSPVRGFCLVGNPYASTINWEKFNRNSTLANSTIYGANFPAASATQSTIWFYDCANKQYETYQQSKTTVDTVSERPSGCSYTGSATNMIASGEGFFIRATATNQSLSFRENCKTTTQPAYGNLNNLMSLRNTNLAATATTPTPQLRLKLIKDSVNYDDIVINFDDNAGTRFNPAQDAEDLGGIGPEVSLSSLSSDSVNIAINWLPLPKTTAPLIIPLLVSATSTGIYQLTMPELQNLPANYEVWLMDNFKKDSLDIAHNPTYSFNIYTDSAASFGTKRFTLLIRQNPALAVHLLDLSATKLSSSVQLNWKIDDDFNPMVFYVEKSIDNGKTFNQLTQVSSNGGNNYTTTDNNPAIGENQYRLRFNNDELPVYSNIVMVNYTVGSPPDAKLTIYPNPTKAMVNLKINNSLSTAYTITLSNSSGSVISRVNSSVPNWQYNAATLMPGMYIMSVVDNQTNEPVGVSKFVKE